MANTKKAGTAAKKSVKKVNPNAELLSVARKAIISGRAQKNAQFNVEKYQQAIENKTVQIDRQVVSLRKQLEDAMAREVAAIASGKPLRSDYGKLNEIYQNELAKLTSDVIFEANKARKAKLYSQVKEEQQDILDQYFTLVADKSMNEIEAIKNVLVAKGLIKETAKVEA